MINDNSPSHRDGQGTLKKESVSPSKDVSNFKIDLNATGGNGGSPSNFSYNGGNSSPILDSAIIKGQNWAIVESRKQEINAEISKLDEKLNLVLAKQEYEYLKSYNIYVKRKEKDMRDLIDQLNKKNSNNTLKDEKINNLEKTIKSIKDDQHRIQKEKDDLSNKLKKWQSKANNFEQERDFLHQQVLESKRQNKLLKLAIGRLQNQINNQVTSAQQPLKLQAPADENEAIVHGDTFLTESKVNAQEDKIAIHNTDNKDDVLKKPDLYGISHLQESKERDTQAQTSYIGAQNSYLTSGTAAAYGVQIGSTVASIMNSNIKGSRAQTRSPQSRYKYIPTENIKFQRFMDLIFKSKMEKEDIKEEILKYVQLLETNYNDTISDLKQILEKEKLKNKRSNFEKVEEISQKNDLENLFVECIEEIRKGIMKRRLKNEIQNKKKFQQIDRNSDEAKEFEQSLLKLAELAKNRVKISDFTNRDKQNLLELFVNNEKTLLKIYEILFPHRAGPGVGQGVSNSMVADSGNGVYGQNAIRALSRGNVNMRGSEGVGKNKQFDNYNQSYNQLMMTAQNTHLLNQISQNNNMNLYQDFMQNSGFNPMASNNFGYQQLPNIMNSQKRQSNQSVRNANQQINTSNQQNQNKNSKTNLLQSIQHNNNLGGYVRQIDSKNSNGESKGNATQDSFMRPKNIIGYNSSAVGQSIDAARNLNIGQQVQNYPGYIGGGSQGSAQSYGNGAQAEKQGASIGYGGVQASHLGVYKHENSLTVIKNSKN